MTTYYLPNGQPYTGETHVMDGVRMSGATHSADSEVLVTENSNSNPQIKNGRSRYRRCVCKPSDVTASFHLAR